MDCKQYQAWIIDLAHGTLKSSHEAALRRHLALCTDCTAKFGREALLLEAIDRRMARASAEEPSNRVCEEVRRQIAVGVDSTPGFWPSHGKVAALAAVCALAIAGAVVWRARRPSHDQLPRTTAAVRQTAQPYRAVPQRSAALRPQLNVIPRSEAVPSLRGRNPAVPFSTHASTARFLAPLGMTRPEKRQTVASAHGGNAPPQSVRSSRREFPKVIVPKNQMALVLELYNDARTGKINGASLVATPPGFKRMGDGTLVAVPIEIKPIEIAKLDAGPDPVRDGRSVENR